PPYYPSPGRRGPKAYGPGNDFRKHSKMPRAPEYGRQTRMSALPEREDYRQMTPSSVPSPLMSYPPMCLGFAVSPTGRLKGIRRELPRKFEHRSKPGAAKHQAAVRCVRFPPIPAESLE